MTIQLNNSVVNNANGSNTTKKTTGNTTSAEAQQNSSNDDDIKLSTRAQKIQKLNEEFFPNGPGSLRITGDFIQRLYDYGFISQSEAEHLGGRVSNTKDLPDSLEKISNNLSIISDRVKLIDSEDSLIDILKRSDAILNNLDGSNPSELAKDITSVNAELTSYLKSDEAEKLTEDEVKALKELSTALRIADRMNPANLSAGKLNQYLSFL
ncbi:hypothetical protein [Litoribrevibacter albus]|uniref:Uncharacterized protein n=1 Tax=Litoribrevibacter albus TaxID=1473156 RepID=A0AA37W7N2_9GAMM|nr:hypothetical protein [Litoribrevibacter albus]GLQ32800.1 hypothetical protein GCM10007876_32790 [Litoribrevibacter albus]